MGKYLLKVNYTAAGAKGLLAEGGSSRRAVVDELAAGMGGSIEAFYYAFGDHDAYVIGDFPTAEDAAAVSLAVGASGAVAIETVVLLTPEQIDEAARKTVGYRAPGA